MAFVDIPGRESLEVPDSWGRDEVTDFVRQTYPDLFEPAVVNTGPSPVTLGPDRAPLTPEARQARIASIQGTPAANQRFAEEQSRIADLDALDAAREAGGITGFLGTSPIMEGPRRVVAGAADFLRVPGALANIALTPAFIPEATRPTAERIGKFLQDLDTSIQGMQEQLLVSERPDADPTLRDVARSFREVGPAAGVADALTLGVNALADSAAYILPSGLVSQALRRVPSLTPRMANALGPMISVAPVETAEALSEYVEAAEDPVLARVAAPIVGAINGALESITDSRILDRLGAGNEARRGVAKFLVGQVLGEGATEAAQEATTIGGRFAATGDVGPDPLNRIGTAALGGVLAGGGMGATVAGINRVVEPPPLGRRERKLALDFAEIASQEGVADLVDFIPEAKFTPEGAPIEGEFVGGRFRVYTPNIRNESRLRGALREEKAHGWIASPEGQTALNTFIAEHPLTPEDQQRLRDDGYLPQESEPSDAYLRRLSDEFVAKLNRDPKWKQWIGEAVAWVKNAIGVSLTNTQAGRLMLRNLRKVAPAIQQGPRRGSIANPRSDRLARPFESLVEGARAMSSWRDWYDRYQADLQELFGPDSGVFQKFLSATSQATGVGGNVSLALKAYRQWLEGAPFEGYLPAVVKNLERVAREEALAGPKISQYGAANAGDVAAVAVDRHIVELLFNARGRAPTPAQVRKAKATISKIGDRLGWTARETQAALWAWNQARKGGTPQSYDTYLKARAQEIGELRARFRASLDAESVRERPSPGAGVGADTRYSLSPERVGPLLDEIRTQYPSAPPIILSPDRDPRGASFDGQNILVSPQDLPGNPAAAKSTILSAMVESGLNLFPESFIPDTFTLLRETDPLGTGRLAQGLGLTEADLRTRQGQAAVVSRALRLQAEGRRLRPWLRRWMRRLRIAPTDQLGDQLQRLAQGILTAYENTEPLPSRQVTPQDQIYADLYSGVWQYAKPFVDRIRDLALDSRFAAEDERMFRNMASRMRSLVEAGRARDIGAGITDRTWDARNPKFVEELRDAGVPVSESDERLHGIYRLEAEARDLVSVLDRAEDLAGLLTRLESTAPGFDRTADEEALARLRKRINAANPDALARAEDLRLQNARRPESKAAMEVLLDPQIRAWLEIIEQIEQSGVTPRAEIPEGNLANAVQIATDTLFLSWRPFRERTAEVYRKFLETTYPARLAALKERLQGFEKDQAKAHVAVGEIFAALAGTAEMSGSLEGRETAEFLRANDELLRRFVVALAKADPDSTVARFRDQFLQLPDTAPLQEQARAELVREIRGAPIFEETGITPDDIRALFGVDSRVANPGLYEWFARQPADVKKEVVRKAMRGAVDERLAAFTSRRQVGVSREEIIREPTTSEIQDRFWAAFQAEAQARGLAELADAARAAGISTGALTRLLELLHQSPGARNLVTQAYDAVSRELRQSALAAILEIEQAKDKAEAAEKAAPAIERFVRARGRATEALRGVEQDIAELEARRKALEMLRDAGAAPVPESQLAVMEMLYDAADGGVLFREFTRADGTQQPEIRIRPRDEYTGALLTRLIEWQQSAEAAINAGSNPEPVTRGLQVAIPLSEFYIDDKFTPEQITTTLAPGGMGDRLTGISPATVFLNVSTRETLSNMVPGVMGRRIKIALEGLVRAGRSVDRLIRKNAARNRKLMEEAATSLGLDLNSQGHAYLLRRARNEVAHRLGRQFDPNEIAVGTSLISLPGRTVTLELLNLLRNDRAIGREAQAVGLQRPYGGTRILLPGARAVRPPGETGILGLARVARRDVYRRLAEVYRTQDPVQIVAFWDSPDAENGLLWHLLDSGRVDLGVERDRDLLPAEQRIANRIFQGAPQPRTFDEVVGLLVNETGLTRSEVRAKLLDELAGYGRVAMARIPSDSGTAPQTRALEVFGESDLTEFTQAAAPLWFPSSWYTYGLSDSLQGFYERVADPEQVQFLTALKEGAEALTTKASEIQRAIAEARIGTRSMKDALAPFVGDIRWHTNDLWRGKEVTPDRAMVAVRRMQTRAGRLEAEIALLRSPVKAWQSRIQRGVSYLVPWMLMWTSPLIKNIVSGPVAARAAHRPMFGVGLATTRAMLDMLVGSPMFFAWDRLLRLAETLGAQFPTREERTTYLESAGIAGSYSRAELGEAEAWSRGDAPSRTERALSAGGDVARRIGEAAGTPLGDTVLNRYIATAMVPVIIWRLKRIAAAWKGRLAQQGVTSRDDSRYALNDEDIGDSAVLRDWLAPVGSPEQVLLDLDQVPIRKFWRHPLGQTLGARVISQVNAATRGNRPNSNPLLTLLGWSANMVNQIVADARTTPDASRWSKLSGHFVRTLSWAALASLAYYLGSFAARAGANAFQTRVAEALQQILLGIDPDDDDPEGLFEALVKLSQVIREWVPGAPLAFDAGARVANAMKMPPGTGDPSPFDASFWSMPSAEIIKELALSVPKGLGFDPENPRLPALGIMSQVLQGAVQMAGGASTVIQDPSPETWEAGKADMKEGTRKLLSVFSMAGQFGYNMLFPEAVVSRQVKAEIVDAAREIGVEPTKPPMFRSWRPPTPVEQALREAARRGDAEAMRRITGFAFNRARNRALDAGKTEQEAQSAGEQAVKGLLVQLDPIRDALGSAITEEQYAKLAPKLGPKVREAIAQKDRAVDVISNTPPDSMRPFQATGAMLSPIKQAPGRRSSFRASRRRGRGRVPRYLLARRRRTRRVRRPRLRGR